MRIIIKLLIHKIHYTIEAFRRQVQIFLSIFLGDMVLYDYYGYFFGCERVMQGEFSALCYFFFFFVASIYEASS